MTQPARAARPDPQPAGPAPALSAMAGWDAALALSYARRGARTVMVKNEHRGPLVVQKALYPEGEASCQTVILHPPGGIAGGDHLVVEVEAGPGTAVLLTTPGATRWYKAGYKSGQEVGYEADSRPASQRTVLRGVGDAIVEWLPQESIVFDGADAQSSLRVDLDQTARAAGWDTVAFGRGAAGERFTRGRFRQSIEIRRAGVLLWAEYGDVRGGDELLSSAAGYAGRAVSGMLWACGGAIADSAAAALVACRERAYVLPPRMLAGVTCLPGGLLLARCLCDSTEQARQYLVQVWQVLRPLYANRVAIAPRLWAT